MLKLPNFSLNLDSRSQLSRQYDALAIQQASQEPSVQKLQEKTFLLRQELELVGQQYFELKKQEDFLLRQAFEERGVLQLFEIINSKLEILRSQIAKAEGKKRVPLEASYQQIFIAREYLAWTAKTIFFKNQRLLFERQKDEDEIEDIRGLRTEAYENRKKLQEAFEKITLEYDRAFQEAKRTAKKRILKLLTNVKVMNF